MASEVLTRRFLWVAVFLVPLAIAIAVWLALHLEEPDLPQGLLKQLDGSTRQVVLVLSPEQASVPARMWLLERASDEAPWCVVGGPVPVSLGRNGLAAGVGEHHGGLPPSLPVKREGDGCSPAGIFRIPSAFGSASSAGIRLDFIRCTPTLRGIDDVNSRYYNQIVDSAKVAADWQSAEEMLRPDGLYALGAVVAHNSQNIPGAGSCIFLHLWSGPSQPTAGCTAMAESDILHLLTWLDPAANPRLIQTVGQ